MHAPPDPRARAWYSSPPRVFQGSVGAVGLVERIELGHVFAGEGEVEDLRVFLDALAMGRLGDHWHIVLKAPAQGYLRGCPS